MLINLLQHLLLIHLLLVFEKTLPIRIGDNVISNNEIKFLGNSVKIKEINFSKRDYYLGLRPEHLSVSENNEYKFNPKVDLIENLGNEKIAYIKMDQYEISAKIPSHHTIENSIGFNSKDIFVFDENGNRIKS